jgi:hypothetical protein
LGQEAVKKNFSKFEILLLGKNKEKYTFRFWPFMLVLVC